MLGSAFSSFAISNRKNRPMQNTLLDGTSLPAAFASLEASHLRGITAADLFYRQSPIMSSPGINTGVFQLGGDSATGIDVHW
jgi:hypothetical protein